MQGKVKTFKATYGFIIPLDSTMQDVFFHFTEIQNMIGYRVLNEDDIVSFDMGENDKGPCGVNVTPLQKATGVVVPESKKGKGDQ